MVVSALLRLFTAGVRTFTSVFRHARVVRWARQRPHPCICGVSATRAAREGAGRVRSGTWHVSLSDAGH
eukprot:664325-Pyramimonas_sp.AAC.1